MKRIELTTIEAIKQAVDAGHTVHSNSDSYTVIKDKIGQYFIKSMGALVGLHGKAGTKYENQLNGTGFFMYEQEKPMADKIIEQVTKFVEKATMDYPDHDATQTLSLVDCLTVCIMETVGNDSELRSDQVYDALKAIVEPSTRQSRDSVKEAGYFGAGFHIDDIIARAKEDDLELTKEQAQEIANDMEANCDANIGVNWDSIEEFTQRYFELNK